MAELWTTGKQNMIRWKKTYWCQIRNEYHTSISMFEKKKIGSKSESCVRLVCVVCTMQLLSKLSPVCLSKRKICDRSNERMCLQRQKDHYRFADLPSFMMSIRIISFLYGLRRMLFETFFCSGNCFCMVQIQYIHNECKILYWGQ